MNEKEASLKKWILKNGYPFEMKVANLFQKKGFKITQSILYKDIDTNKYRELDIIAYYGKIINGVSFNFSFVIECKKSTDKPWIVFKNDNLINSKLNRFKPFATRNAEILFENSNVNENLQFNNIFPDINSAGYNVVIAYRDSKDIAYNSSLSLLKACNYIKNKFNDSNLRQCNFYIPLIIIEGELYDARLNIKEEIDFELVDFSIFMNTKIFNEKDSTTITIASSKNLGHFIDDLKNSLNLFFKQYSKEVIEVSLSNPTNTKNDNFNSVDLF
ncbi:hypothetical protein [Polaribacter cellanae]|uniref:Uncharacterized protein n=1 Tax=Polaribacter cellanae TaxID=2818493 RepID=A0A975H7P0_9FLAO|nr:hypothetical protein [Polaribacter cellanae]QTE23174.1 hypothetical protein J3359_02530 [Polaribacter cellanae]